MKNLCLTAVFVLFINFLSIAQTLPIGLRLKDITAGPLIGSVITYGYNNTDSNGFITGPRTSELTTVFNREFNLGTATCYPKWEGWVNEGQFDYFKFNTLVNWLYERDKFTIMHMLCGPDNYFPDWFVKGNWNARQQDSLLKTWIYGIMDANNNKNKVQVWNVVNEAFEYNDEGRYWQDDKNKWNDMGWEDDASGLQNTDKINSRHPKYIRKAFEYAADKTNKILELRETGFEFGNTKSKAFYQLVKHLLNTGVNIGAVGLQCHFDIGKVNPAALQEQVKLYTALGIQVYFTELDIGNTQLPFDNAKAQQQKTDYYNVLTAAIETGISGINVWGITDGNEFWRTTENSLPFTENFIAKPAYYGIQKALEDGINKYDTIITATYTLTAKHSGKVLDVKASDTGNGATVWQYTRNNTTAQQWQIQHIQGGYHKLIAACSGKALDVGAISCKDGALLQQWSFGNGGNQLWKFEKQPNGFYKIAARHSGKALDVSGVSTADGGLVQQWRFSGGDNQLWALEKISTNAKNTPINDKINQLQLYPNPGSIGKIVQLIYTNNSSRETGIITVIDAQGKTIEQKQIILQNGSNIYPINTEGWVPGIYNIKLYTSLTKKQVVKKLEVF